ncbi:MAG TPA: hypothetical protein VGQ52_10600 [Gemmatimonadaceae bacterium]|jgi:hypothetical protein|nr:hypothetical protein [Gemmatimonadaceae bacterium]
MTRFIAPRFSVLLAALIITATACSDENLVGTQLSSNDPAPSATGFLAFPNDPSIADILVSSCYDEIPGNSQHLTPWQHSDGLEPIELAVGCYHVRVMRITGAGLTVETQRVIVYSGEVTFLI